MFPFRWDAEFVVADNGKPFPPADIVVGRIDSLLAYTGHYETSRAHSTLDYASTPFRRGLLFNPVEQNRVRRAFWNGNFQNVAGLMDRGSIRITDVSGGLEVHVHYDLRRSSVSWTIFGVFISFALWKFEVAVAVIVAFIAVWCSLAVLFAWSGVRTLPRSIRRIANGDFPRGPVSELI